MRELGVADTWRELTDGLKTKSFANPNPAAVGYATGVGLLIFLPCSTLYDQNTDSKKWHNHSFIFELI